MVMPRGQRTPTATLFEKYSRLAASGCLEWVGGRNRHGYGVIYIQKRPMRAHRVHWEMHCGPIPAGKWVLHKCDNPACISIEHLFLGSPKDNTQDMLRKGRAAVGERAGSSKLFAYQVQALRRLSPYLSRCDLAVMFDISISQVDRVCRRSNWASV